MKPVYFPYTYLHPSVAESLRAFFPAVAVYQPVAGRLPDEMRPLAAEGFLEVMAPPAGDEEDFDRLIRDFHQWGSLHQQGAGLRTAILHGRSFPGPISADGSLEEIVSEIRRRLAPEAASRDSAPTLTARVFLHLAQAADQLDHQISSDLVRYEKAQARLFDALKGEADRAGSEPGLWGRADRDDIGADHLGLRTTAWARLFSSHPYPSPVFVTHGRGAIRHLAENAPSGLRIRLAELPHVLQHLVCEKQPPAGDIMSRLAALAAAPLSLRNLPNDDTEEKPAGDRAEEPWIHLWPHISPHHFFGRTLATGPTESSFPPPPFTWRNTLVVQIH